MKSNSDIEKTGFVKWHSHRTKLNEDYEIGVDGKTSFISGT
jgi:hypothetical protein